MKNIFTLSLLCISGLLFAQEEMTMEMDSSASIPVTQKYNHWSIDLGAGVQKPTRPFTEGAFMNTPSLTQADLGIRYMINNKFGLNLDLGFNYMESDDDSDLEFQSNYYRATIEGVANLGEVFGFREWTNGVNLLFHTGFGFSGLRTQEPIDGEDTDWMMNFQAGLTPQVRLSDKWAVFGDLSAIGHVRQTITWDGLSLANENRGFNSLLVNASVGVTYYFGNKQQHADWYSENVMQKLSDLEMEMDKMISDLGDDDQDGVPNYLDRDNTTESGVRVDSKGRAIDQNQNGIPDDMESALKAQYASKTDVDNAMNDNSSTAGTTMKKLINSGYINVYFEFNSAKPTTYSLGAINTIITYMQENSSANATLTGYADELGNEQYNTELSERRAKMVRDVMVAAGIDESRLTLEAGGEDTSVDKSSGNARQLVRRVTFSVD
ncbi:cell envelope biogenesis protein OmpA [Nonlabens spongiae]|uniref:Cell envelope biogenesis protein OmpA n=1 Tax=Nonlabens spongiae TaxID=331648 RepID=A0A1W6MJJ9_9FLAO|nr:OmpA family protein [Nonlabens spongiae]ARN77781.1 cell envelope biogenesis protein OmpA [Nonlabens spongiae]